MSRLADVAVRSGGDEFVMLPVPHTDAEGASALVRRLHKVEGSTTTGLPDIPREALSEPRHLLYISRHGAYVNRW